MALPTEVRRQSGRGPDARIGLHFILLPLYAARFLRLTGGALLFEGKINKPAADRAFHLLPIHSANYCCSENSPRRTLTAQLFECVALPRRQNCALPIRAHGDRDRAARAAPATARAYGGAAFSLPHENRNQLAQSDRQQRRALARRAFTNRSCRSPTDRRDFCARCNCTEASMRFHRSSRSRR